MLLKENQVFFMEAMKSRFVPAYQKMSSLIKEGLIGEITNISTSFCRLVPEENSGYYYQPIQGGCLLDMGIYNASLIEDFTTEPLSLQQVDYQMHTSGVEVYVNAVLANDHVTCQLESGFDRNLPVEAVITGTKGKIVMPDFHRGSSITISLNQNKEGAKNYDIPYHQDDFYGEIVHVMDCFSKGEVESSVMSRQASVNCAEMIDQIKKKLSY
ncbi:Gfo/Idh/MocA family protein [Vagococcus elongatus]